MQPQSKKYKFGYAEISCKNILTKQQVNGYAQIKIIRNSPQGNIAEIGIVEKTEIWGGCILPIYDCAVYNKGSVIENINYVETLGELI